MTLFPSLEKKYSKETQTALQAQRLAHEISQAPIVFQVSRLMVKFGILQMLIDSKNGLTLNEIVERLKTRQTASLKKYAVQCLLESSLTIGTILFENERFTCSKAGWFLLNDPAVKVNLNFNHDVNYLGLFRLEESLLNGKPEGLKIFGDWTTIYEGLSQLPENVQHSWFAFDHYYSDESWNEALQIIFENQPKTLLDVGGNTGRFATRVVQFNDAVQVTIMDLPQQLELMRKATANEKGAERINGHGVNLLDENVPFPAGFEAIMMSQFLDCFSEKEVTSILSRAAKSMSENSRLYIMETFWDRQRFETAAYALTQISLYFTALANGNSKMYHSEDMMRCIENAGLAVEKIHDGIGQGHSIAVCRKI
ncbi:MAG: methyltransferase domain-containing protein [Prevotellaceae bacterium]|jgi:ubiquinone/menaquinone biosynthesis C-methylase UbiE|nr:methyltransferase domain-containing protein [Prevotellaceae bacterium]